MTRAADEEEEIKNLDTDLSAATLQPSDTAARSESEAVRLWTHYSTLTHSLSLTLTEQLRLVPAPTMDTKMRDNFRTGKRYQTNNSILCVLIQARQNLDAPPRSSTMRLSNPPCSRRQRIHERICRRPSGI